MRPVAQTCDQRKSGLRGLLAVWAAPSSTKDDFPDASYPVITLLIGAGTAGIWIPPLFGANTLMRRIFS
jgi:hypothetical protein